MFLAGAWQDEQTGGHFPAMLDDFTVAAPLRDPDQRLAHGVARASAFLDKYADFLDLYVGQRVPTGRKGVRGPDPGGGASSASAA